MIAVLGIDALEASCVKKFGCRNLSQESCGATDLSGFSEPRTVVIWSSFLSGRNTEREVLASKDMWGFRLDAKDTFFSAFERFSAIDVPGFSQDVAQHKREREALKGFFGKKVTVEEYDAIALEWHKKVREEFFSALEGDYGLVMGYFDAIDLVGHLSFGVEGKMRMLYDEMDGIAGKVRAMGKGPLLVVSDHGMKPLGSRYGDHSESGFWSLNSRKDLGMPKPEDFARIIASL
ncbi:MAG: alkaline phosphatase family protein [Candidatus ainarchaeum sp.]|nr:alkaline phosphatase family protein [Candidatus ainarchaeum sp.]